MGKIIGIYKITNPNGRVYVGKSTYIQKRWMFYKGLHCKSQSRLYRSLLKHGVSNHKFEILEECIKDELNIKERYYQDLYNCTGEFGMNCALNNEKGGHCEILISTREKIRIALTGRSQSLDTIKKITESKKINPYVYTDEVRRKMSESAKKRPPFSEETRTKISEGSKRPQSEASKMKISLAGKGRKMSKEFSEAVGNRTRGRKASFETRMKISNSRLGKTVSEETRKKISIGHMGKKIKLESRLKMSLNNGSSVIVLNKENGVFYSTIKLAAESHDMSVKLLYKMISGRKENKSKFIKA